jgi:hydroxyethylthiazole kinase
MFENIIKNVHNRHPLIHCITNYVSINDCANIVLACGGAPIMAEDINEVSQITSICQGLDINIGMLNDNKLSSMLKAGATANELGIPVILDPVGAGSSDYRIKAVQNLMSNVQFGVIRGNVSEIKAIAAKQGIHNIAAGVYETMQKNKSAMGVEAGIADKITDGNIKEMADFINKLSQKTGAVIAVTGGIDMVADENRVYAIRNGHKMMSLVTGAGCQLSALTSATISIPPVTAITAPVFWDSLLIKSAISFILPSVILSAIPASTPIADLFFCIVSYTPAAIL